VGRTRALAGFLAVSAGLVSVVGSLLVWMRLSVGGQAYVELRGAPEGPDGWVVLGAGVVMVLAGVLLTAGWLRRILGVLIVAAGIVAVVSGALALTTGRDTLADGLAGAFGSSRDAARERVDRMIGTGEAELSVEPGLVLLLTGGGLSALASAAALAGRRPPRPAIRAEVPPPDEPVDVGVRPGWPPRDDGP
jgi:hypothetical protein